MCRLASNFQFQRRSWILPNILAILVVLSSNYLLIICCRHKVESHREKEIKLLKKQQREWSEDDAFHHLLSSWDDDGTDENKSSIPLYFNKDLYCVGKSMTSCSCVCLMYFVQYWTYHCSVQILAKCSFNVCVVIYPVVSLLRYMQWELRSKHSRCCCVECRQWWLYYGLFALVKWPFQTSIRVHFSNFHLFLIPLRICSATHLISNEWFSLLLYFRNSAFQLRQQRPQ